jgi:heme-degrading monooxygenase HmoA
VAGIALTPDPPYVAVIFTSLRTEVEDGYAEAAARMEALAREQPGFLGVESARSGVGITVSYWESEEHARAWKRVAEHIAVQREGRTRWYSAYTVRIAHVAREYRCEREAPARETGDRLRGAAQEPATKRRSVS